MRSRTTVAVAALAAVLAGCAPRLSRGSYAGNKYEILTSYTKPLQADVVIIVRRGEWFAPGSSKGNVLGLFDLENRSSEPRCAAIYFRKNEGWQSDSWGNGVVYRLAPGETLREAAAILGAAALDYSLTGEARPVWGDSCETFPSWERVFGDR